MAAIHIRNASESLLASLRERAARHGRSMQQEVLSILQEAAAGGDMAEELPPIELVTVKTSGTATWRRGDMYGDEGR